MRAPLPGTHVPVTSVKEWGGAPLMKKVGTGRVQKKQRHQNPKTREQMLLLLLLLFDIEMEFYNPNAQAQQTHFLIELKSNNWVKHL